LNRIYLAAEQLQVEQMGRGVAWLDAGTHESLMQAANFVQAVEDRQGMMISCPEEISYRIGLINETELQLLAAHLGESSYAKNVRGLIKKY
jgi:glucose-1-phosphate thymidylyltransferase